MRTRLLGAALLVAACSAPKPPPPTVTVAPTADTVVVPVVSITAVSRLDDDRWVVLAPVGNQVDIVDFAAKSVTPFPGINKTEVPHPTTLIGLGDTIIVGDWGLARFTEWTLAGQRIAAWPAPDPLSRVLPRARDAAGQWYFQLSPDPKADGSGLLDSSVVVRSDPQLSHFDTVARLTPSDLTKVPTNNGFRYQRRIMSGDDAWGVLSDGTLWIARVFQNQIEWHRPGGAKVVRSPRLPDRVLSVTPMDRELFVQRYPEDQRDAVRNLPNSPIKPPFEHVFPVPGSRMWLAKSDTALSPVRHFQVVDSTGVLYYVAVPSRGTALSIGPRWILMGEEFPGGVRLMRYATPPAPSDSTR